MSDERDDQGNQEIFGNRNAESNRTENNENGWGCNWWVVGGVFIAFVVLANMFTEGPTKEEMQEITKGNKILTTETNDNDGGSSDYNRSSRESFEREVVAEINQNSYSHEKQFEAYEQWTIGVSQKGGGIITVNVYDEDGNYVEQIQFDGTGTQSRTNHGTGSYTVEVQGSLSDQFTVTVLD